MIDMIWAEIIGAVLLVIGILNMKGNISTIHRYHRHRVKEEDVLPFGRLMGAGTISAAIAIMVMGVTMYFAEANSSMTLAIIGGVAMALGLIICAVLCIYAMIKYNKGIF